MREGRGHARGEGERVLALESREGTRASRRVEEVKTVASGFLDPSKERTQALISLGQPPFFPRFFFLFLHLMSSYDRALKF